MVLLNTCWWLGSWNRCSFFLTRMAKHDVCLVQLDLGILLQNFAKETGFRCLLLLSFNIALCRLFSSVRKSHALILFLKVLAAMFSLKNLNVNLAKKIKSKRKTATLINSFVYRDIFMWSVWMIHSLSPGRHKKFRFFIKVKIQLMQISGRIGDGFLPFS